LKLIELRFDYMFNSLSWWDFRSSWLFEQYDQFRRFGATISAPDDRIHHWNFEGSDPDVKRRYFCSRYLLAAFFSKALSMPAGYERGRSGLWSEEEAGAFDIRDYLKAVNAIKANMDALNQERKLIPVQFGGQGVTAMLRFDGEIPYRSGEA